MHIMFRFGPLFVALKSSLEDASSLRGKSIFDPGDGRRVSERFSHASRFIRARRASDWNNPKSDSHMHAELISHTEQLKLTKLDPFLCRWKIKYCSMLFLDRATRQKEIENVHDVGVGVEEIDRGKGKSTLPSNAEKQEKQGKLIEKLSLYVLCTTGLEAQLNNYNSVAGIKRERKKILRFSGNWTFRSKVWHFK